MAKNSTSGSTSGDNSSFKTLAILCLLVVAFFGLCTTVHGVGSGSPHSEHLILSAAAYEDSVTSELGAQLSNRILYQPFNIVALVLFICAIVHTFFTHKFTVKAHELERIHRARAKESHADGIRFDLDKRLETDKSFSAEIFHFLGEIEAVFGVWLIPLIIALTYFFDWHTAMEYIQSRDYTEPMFVVVIMTLAATRPIVCVAESVMQKIAGFGSGTPVAWWLTILTVGPILGSFITEPAAMTLCAMLLTKQFYQHAPPPRLAYATLGLLFTNISVGGTLTHFAAPPVLMVAKAWNWDSLHMLKNFGWKAVVGIIIANSLYLWFFRHDLKALAKKVAENTTDTPNASSSESPVPVWITIIHFLMLGGMIAANHYPAMFIGTFLLFLAFYQATAAHQTHLFLRGPILVGCFLAGLVVHGGLQEWWISAILQKADEGVLMVSAIVLTAFNDNAAITYLTTLVPTFTDSMKYAVVAGAVAGGGLTVIANAPNPAGYSLLSPHFEDGISAIKLFLAALIPTIIVTICFAFL